MKRILFGITWCVLLYFGACFVLGAIAGGIASSRCHDAGTASFAARQAGEKIVTENRLAIFVGVAVFTTVSTALGLLPGTQKSSSPPHNPSDWRDNAGG